ncbi:MAG: hypothetical protein HY293_16770 [Planctomycetes bacterium]|nr:hypothetical protein [Planctomycetota bacterium]
MKQALFVISGVAIGLLAALVAVASTKTEFLPRAEAQAGPGGGNGASGSPILATGGSTQNQNDLCWVLTKVKPVKGPERSVLVLYKAEDQGKHFNLKDVRFIDADIRVVELDAKRHDPSVATIMKSLPPEEVEALRPPR